MPMIDIYAVQGTFSDPAELATRAAATVMQVEGVPDIPMFRKNTAGFVHEMAPGAIANVDGDQDYVRVQVLTNKGAWTAPNNSPSSSNSPTSWPQQPATPT